MSGPSQQLPVLISGSGLSGLLIARALATHSIPFRIYERDETPVKRAQGYRLRMSTEGLASIKAILPDPAWTAFFQGVATTRGGGLRRVNAITGEQSPVQPTTTTSNENDKEERVTAANDPPPISGLGANGEIYGVSRGYLRAELMKGIEDKVEYGKQTVSYTSDEKGVIATFADGTSSPLGSLLIGADGVHSHVASQLSKGAIKVYDTKTRMIHGQTGTKAFRALGEGVFAISDEQSFNKDGGGENKFVRVICNVRPGDMDDPSMNFGWTMVGSPGTIEVPGDRFQVVGKTAAALARTMTASWSESIRPIFDEQIEDEAGFWKMTTSSPDGVPEWPNDARVTVVGDAAHSMTPAGGNGANTALQTASMLGTILRQHNGWTGEVTSAYEKEMRPFASKNVQASFNTAKSMFNIADIEEDVRSSSTQTPSS